MGTNFNDNAAAALSSAQNLAPVQDAGALGSVFMAPRIFIAIRPNCSTTKAHEFDFTPQMIQSRLLNRKTQKPQFRFLATLEATSHEAIKVTAIAGH